MDKFIAFISDNYIWFLVITIFLIFALIGYLYDTKRSRTDYIYRNNKNEELINENIIIPENKSINDLLSNNVSDGNTLNLETNETNNNN